MLISGQLFSYDVGPLIMHEAPQAVPLVEELEIGLGFEFEV